MLKITDHISYDKIMHTANTVHIICFNQTCPDSTLLLSKISEAISPSTQGNHIGEGSDIDTFLTHQKAVRLIINGGFNHYRKNFYDWKHQDFNIGDPVGLTKIREYYFEDYIDLEYYGFFVQDTKNKPWKIVQKNNLSLNEKYILGCTPLLIFNKKALPIPDEIMQPVAKGKINPPSVLGHGKQCHPRTAIGMNDNDIYFINIEQPGFTLAQVQQFGVELGLDSMLNLDGGGSAQFRLLNNDHYIQNNIPQEDKRRILGHAIVIFDEKLQ